MRTLALLAPSALAILAACSPPLTSGDRCPAGDVTPVLTSTWESASNACLEGAPEGTQAEASWWVEPSGVTSGVTVDIEPRALKQALYCLSEAARALTFAERRDRPRCRVEVRVRKADPR